MAIIEEALLVFLWQCIYISNPISAVEAAIPEKCLEAEQQRSVPLPLGWPRCILGRQYANHEAPPLRPGRGGGRRRWGAALHLFSLCFLRKIKLLVPYLRMRAIAARLRLLPLAGSNGFGRWDCKNNSISTS